MEKEGGSGGVQMEGREEKGLGEGMPEGGEDQVFFFLVGSGETPVRLSGGNQG